MASKTFENVFMNRDKELKDDTFSNILIDLQTFPKYHILNDSEKKNDDNHILKIPSKRLKKREIKINDLKNDNFKDVLLNCKELTTDEISNDELFRFVNLKIAACLNGIDQAIGVINQNVILMNDYRNFDPQRDPQMHIRDNAEKEIMQTYAKTLFDISHEYNGYMRKKTKVYNDKLKNLRK